MIPDKLRVSIAWNAWTAQMFAVGGVDKLRPCWGPNMLPVNLSVSCKLTVLISQHLLSPTEAPAETCLQHELCLLLLIGQDRRRIWDPIASSCCCCCWLPVCSQLYTVCLRHACSIHPLAARYGVQH